MKTLYHGGLEIVASPEIRKPDRTLDFGSGFYLTSSRKQATDWVKRRMENNGVESGYVNQYVFDDLSAEKILNVKKFASANDEWLDFVMDNRRNMGFTHPYDVVIGPVANDKVYTAFALYESGTLSRELLIQELKTYRLVDQYLFHTVRSLAFLKHVSANPLKL